MSRSSCMIAWKCSKQRNFWPTCSARYVISRYYLYTTHVLILDSDFEFIFCRAQPSRHASSIKNSKDLKSNNLNSYQYKLAHCLWGTCFKYWKTPWTRHINCVAEKWTCASRTRVSKITHTYHTLLACCFQCVFWGESNQGIENSISLKKIYLW